MKCFLKLTLACVFLGTVVGQFDDTECPYQRTENKACAWMSDCPAMSDCSSKCVANVFGENHLDEPLEQMLHSTLTCAMVSYVVRSASTGIASRRLESISTARPKMFQAIKDALKAMPVKGQARHLLDASTMAATCATDAEVDTAAPALESMLEESEPGGDVEMTAAEKATMDFLMSLVKDTGKLKSFLSSSCATTELTGGDLSLYLYFMDMGEDMDNMPTSLEVCVPSNPEVAEKSRQLMDLLQSTECHDSSAVTHGACIGWDAMLMHEACMNKAAMVFNLESTDVTATVNAWTAIHQACITVTNATECQGTAMDTELQQGKAAMENMEQDATATHSALVEQVSEAPPTTIGFVASTLVALLLIAM